MRNYDIFVAKMRNYDIFVAKTRNYDIFVAKIYDYALTDSFWGFPRLIDSPTSYATLSDEKFVKGGKFSGRVQILTHPSFLFDKLPRLGLKDFKLSLLDTEIFTLLL